MIRNGIHVRFAIPSDASQIIALFIGGFHPDIVEFLAYGCKGAAEYIRLQLPSTPVAHESAYFVAEADNRIVGAAEVRRRRDGLHLNYIAVSPEHQGRRVGTTLFLEALRTLGVNAGQVGLDVFQDNIHALDWYRRLGFAVKTSKEFVEVRAPADVQDGPIFVSGLPQAEACQERFGFSNFNLTARDATFSVGRVGDQWFRLSDPEALRHAQVFSTLRTLDPARRISAVVPEFSTVPSQIVRCITRTHWMEVEIPRLMSSLV